MSSLPHTEVPKTVDVATPDLTVIDGEGEGDIPVFAGGENVDMPRGEAISLAKSERPLHQTLEDVLGRVGLMPEDESEQDALRLRLDALAQEVEDEKWIRPKGRTSFAPDVLTQAREATAEYDEAPLLRVVTQVSREYPNQRNQQLELMARRLIESEIAQD